MKVMETDIALGRDRRCEESLRRGQCARWSQAVPVAWSDTMSAFLKHDNAGMQEQVAWATGQSLGRGKFH